MAGMTVQLTRAAPISNKVDEVDAIIRARRVGEAAGQLGFVAEVAEVEVEGADRLVRIDLPVEGIQARRPNVGRRGQAVEMRAVAMRPAVAEQEHGQPLVIVAIFADLLAPIED